VYSGDFTGIPTRWLLCGIVAEPGKGHSLSGVATVVANCLLRHAVLRSGSDICRTERNISADPAAVTFRATGIIRIFCRCALQTERVHQTA
jgi:hypothetical protein